MSSLPAQVAILLCAVALLAIVLPRVLPLAVVRLLPLLSSTVSLMWAADEYMFLSAWLSPSYRDQANALLPAWFSVWGAMGSKVLFSSFPLSLAAAMANALTSAAAPRWYAIGLCFVMAHFAYAPTALKWLAAFRKDEPDRRPTESLRSWVDMHVLRSLTADLPALVCFATALVESMQHVA